MMMAKVSIDEVFDTLETDDKLNRKQKAQFHLYNPNGACMQLTKLMQEVIKDVETGKVKGGLILAYGGHFHLSKLIKLTAKRNGGSVWETNYHINGLRECYDSLYVAWQEQLKQYEDQ